MSNLKFSAIVLMAVASVLWTVAVMVKVLHGDADGWVDAGTILYIVSLVPLFIESKIEERRAR